MVAILIILGVALINSVLFFADELLNGMFDVAFNCVETISSGMFEGIFTNLSITFYRLGTALIILKFLKKAFDIYVLWSDGDPDVEPINLLTNFIKAIVTAICFPYFYDVFVDLAKDVIDTSFNDISGYISIAEAWANTAWLTIGITPTVFALIFLVCVIILYFKMLKLGLEIMIMRIGVPLACTGLLDNDKGYFKNYLMVFIKTIITVVVQIILIRLGVAFATNINLVDPLSLFWAIACMLTAMSTPKLLSEFMIPSNGSGGITQKIYSAGMAVNMVKKVFK